MGWSEIGSMIGLGVGAGVFGGMFGIGGGLIIVPALVLIFGFDQKTANGTSLLAQLLPVAFLAVREYWKRGEVSIPGGLGVAVGLTLGTLIGAMLTGQLSPTGMKRAYGGFLIIVGAYFLFITPHKPAQVVPAAAKP